jgi:hypothetical protein
MRFQRFDVEWWNPFDASLFPDFFQFLLPDTRQELNVCVT